MLRNRLYSLVLGAALGLAAAFGGCSNNGNKGSPGNPIRIRGGVTQFVDQYETLIGRYVRFNAVPETAVFEYRGLEFENDGGDVDFDNIGNPDIDRAAFFRPNTDTIYLHPNGRAVEIPGKLGEGEFREGAHGYFFSVVEGQFDPSLESLHRIVMHFSRTDYVMGDPHDSEQGDKFAVVRNHTGTRLAAVGILRETNIGDDNFKDFGQAWREELHDGDAEEVIITGLVGRNGLDVTLTDVEIEGVVYNLMD